MFYYLSGTVTHIEPYLAVIDCGGVGYACRTTSYTLSALKKGEKGKECVRFSVTVEEEETNESLVCCHILVAVSRF